MTALKREAQIALRLMHPHVCRLYGFHSDEELKFLVMEHIDGRTLGDELAARFEGRMALTELLPLARQLAGALDYAHAASYVDLTGRRVCGVLHRDLKPGNVLVLGDGAAPQAKLMDFGIAREIHNTMTRVTGRTSQTPLYASPEQFRGKALTPASDLYAFAAVLYECLAGHPLVSPHGDLRYQILDRPFQPLGDLSDAVNAALSDGLAKDAAQRPETAKELVERMGGTCPAPVPTAAAGCDGVAT